jgi:hypothetical protein
MLQMGVTTCGDRASDRSGIPKANN